MPGFQETKSGVEITAGRAHDGSVSAATAGAPEEDQRGLSK